METNAVATSFENSSYDVSEDSVETLLVENYDIVPEKVQRLDGYEDFNFRILPAIKINEPNDYTKICQHGYVLKILSWENTSNVEFTTEYINILLHLREQAIRVKCPYPIKNKKGEYKTYWRKKYDLNDVKKAELDPFKLESFERIHAVFLFEYIPGKLLDNVKFGRKLCVSIGELMGSLHHALKPFSGSETLQRPHYIWSLKYVTDSLKYAKYVEEAKRAIVTKAVLDFQNEVLPRMNELEQGIIHGDFNKANCVVIDKGESDPEICGIIDFNDISHSCYLFDFAITILYITMDTPDHLEQFSASILSGYPRKITDLELNLLKTCICARLAQSLILGLYSYHLCPSNAYLLTTQEKGWPLLQKLLSQKNEDFVASIVEEMSLGDS